MRNDKVAILVDFGVDVPEELIKKYEMCMIPLKIIYKDRAYTDKIDVTPEEIYRCLPGEIPGTSLPDGGSIAEISEQTKKDGYEKVLTVTISNELSGTYNVVRLIIEQQEGLEAHVLNTRSIGIGASFPAVQAVEWLEESVEWNQPISNLNELVEGTKVFFDVVILEYLQKGGWIGLVTSILGTALKLNPIIPCNDEGIYYTIGRTRGRKRSLDKTVAYVKEKIGNAKVFNLVVVHGDTRGEAIEMETRLKREFLQVDQVYFGQISPALVVHTDPELLGAGMQVLGG